MRPSQNFYMMNELHLKNDICCSLLVAPWIGQLIKVGFKEAFIWDQNVIFFGLLVVFLPISPLHDLRSSFFDGTSLNLQLQKRFNNNSHVQYRPWFGGGGNTCFIYLQPWRSVPFATFPLNSVNVYLFNFQDFNDSRQISSCCLPPSAVWTLTVHSLSLTHTSLVGFFFLFSFCHASRNTAAAAAVAAAAVAAAPAAPAAAVVLLQSDRAGRFGQAEGMRRNGMMGNDVRGERKLGKVFPGDKQWHFCQFPSFWALKNENKNNNNKNRSEFSLLSWKLVANELTAASCVCHSKPLPQHPTLFTSKDSDWSGQVLTGWHWYEWALFFQDGNLTKKKKGLCSASKTLIV